MHTWFGPVFSSASQAPTSKFNNRLVNAIVDAVLFLVVFGLIVYFGHYSVAVSSATP